MITQVVPVAGGLLVVGSSGGAHPFVPNELYDEASDKWFEMPHSMVGHCFALCLLRCRSLCRSCCFRSPFRSRLLDALGGTESVRARGGGATRCAQKEAAAVLMVRVR